MIRYNFLSVLLIQPWGMMSKLSVHRNWSTELRSVSMNQQLLVSVNDWVVNCKMNWEFFPNIIYFYVPSIVLSSCEIWLLDSQVLENTNDGNSLDSSFLENYFWASGVAFSQKILVFKEWFRSSKRCFRYPNMTSCPFKTMFEILIVS